MRCTCGTIDLYTSNPFEFQTGVYSNTVVLQHHSVVMTKADKIYKVKCTYDMSSKNITFGMVPIRFVFFFPSTSHTKLL